MHRKQIRSVKLLWKNRETFLIQASSRQSGLHARKALDALAVRLNDHLSINRIFLQVCSKFTLLAESGELTPRGPPESARRPVGVT